MNETKEIAFFERVVDLYNALKIPIEQSNQFSMNNLLEIHKTIPYKSPVFRTNYYSFIFIKNGKGNYTTDEQTFEYGSGTIYFTNPGHIKSFEFFELKEAYLITFSEEFLKTNAHQNIFSDFPFLLSETVPPQNPNKQEFKGIETIYLQILNEYQNNSLYKQKIISNLLVALLLKIKALFWQNYYPLEEGNNQSRIVKAFKENLEKHYRDLAENNVDKVFQPQDYANLQQLNSSYFSQVIKSKTGKSPSSWINERTTSYAKALLKNTSKSIKEITYTLAFTETAHFSNFFKKQTGFSPSAYRNK
ncbi:AraC family transcriptional regulator [Zhouia spongiae]|uniref:AraC family transcriptional regulator n=1 Tax=Zhouia spongiae TaxID=2202721 RepID=A0ABY3YRR9_9FLAO|nr:AraC family transcriptional regulator [Zhouia spongiae]UNZ00240.1 AraC family transcriptional regulator [Zhouia spongiae]